MEGENGKYGFYPRTVLRQEVLRAEAIGRRLGLLWGPGESLKWPLWWSA
jgi:hypothetical protein